MLTIPSQTEPIVDSEGRLTPAWNNFLSGLQKRMSDISQITKPTGGATVDIEARDTIDSIIDASK